MACVHAPVRLRDILLHHLLLWARQQPHIMHLAAALQHECGRCYVVLITTAYATVQLRCGVPRVSRCRAPLLSWPLLQRRSSRPL